MCHFFNVIKIYISLYLSIASSPPSKPTPSSIRTCIITITPTSSESQDQVESGFLLNIVVRECSSILKLLSCEDESLLIWWDTFLVLDLCFHVFNGVSWLNIKGDCLSCKGLDENLHFWFFLFKLLFLIIIKISVLK